MARTPAQSQEPSVHHSIPPTDLMTSVEVAQLFNVSQLTVDRWCRGGKLPFIALPSGRRRFHRHLVMELLNRPTEP